MLVKDLIEALQIITRHDPVAEIAVDRRSIHVGDFRRTATAMTPQDFERMAQLGWHEDEGSWTRHV